MVASKASDRKCQRCLGDFKQGSGADQLWSTLSVAGGGVRGSANQAEQLGRSPRAEVKADWRHSNRQNIVLFEAG
jgi:hypothetical protein